MGIEITLYMPTTWPTPKAGVYEIPEGTLRSELRNYPDAMTNKMADELIDWIKEWHLSSCSTAGRSYYSNNHDAGDFDVFYITKYTKTTIKAYIYSFVVQLITDEDDFWHVNTNSLFYTHSVKAALDFPYSNIF